MLGQNHTVRVTCLNSQGSFPSIASLDFFEILSRGQLVAKEKTHLRCLGSLLKQVGWVLLRILQNQAIETPLSSGFDNDARPKRKAQSQDRNIRTVGLHEILEGHDSFDELIQVFVIVVIDSLYIRKTDSILVGLGHEIGSIHRTFHIIANAPKLQDLHRRAHFDINPCLGGTSLLHNCRTMTKMLKFAQIFGLFDVTLLGKHIKQILDKGPNMSTGKRWFHRGHFSLGHFRMLLWSIAGNHLFSCRKHERHKLCYSFAAPTHTMSSLAIVRCVKMPRVPSRQLAQRLLSRTMSSARAQHSRNSGLPLEESRNALLF
jgi:hypothetical protein